MTYFQVLGEGWGGPHSHGDSNLGRGPPTKGVPFTNSKAEIFLGLRGSQHKTEKQQRSA